MFLKILLVATLGLGLASAKPPSVVQYWGVPGNNNDEPTVQFVDLGKPIIKEYTDEHIGLNIPLSPQPQATVTPKPLIIEYSHNPINDHYKVPPKQIQVVEVADGRVRRVTADTNPQFKNKRSPSNENHYGRKSLRNHLRLRQPEQVIASTTTTEATTKLVPEFYTDLDEEVSESPELSEKEAKKVLEDEFKKQAESAKYQFASNVDDEISGNQHHREETRDGVNVKGSYSYNDGFFRHTVHYVADDKGYRVIKQEHEPLGDGPQYNPEGEVKVATYMDGKTLNYRVKEDDYAPHTKLWDGKSSVRKQHPLVESSAELMEGSELAFV